MRRVVFEGLRLEDLSDHGDKIAGAFEESGIVVLKGILSGRSEYENYLTDLRSLLTVLMEDKLREAKSRSRELDDLLLGVFQADPYYPRYIHDLGTHPMKLLSGNILKYQPDLLSLVRRIHGPRAMVASPTGSDNLLLFFPGKEFEKYTLPLHQDFPYIMQSAAQITVWVPLTKRYEGVGGFAGWLGSHKLGICKNRHGDNGLEVVVPKAELEAFERFVVDWELGDVVISHSLLLHQSEPNITKEKVRAVQIFRFSDLMTDEAKAYMWQSTAYQSTKGSVTFGDVYPKLLVPDDISKA
jgi:ectoine hydroxylase-related dioxygenase (phytanoyl-CoA dioxygenase family)